MLRKPVPLALATGTRTCAGARATSSKWYFFLLIGAVAIYYLFLLSNGSFQLFAHEMLDEVYNNMLLHLLQGEFIVSSNVIDFEAFTRDGKTYAYFGMFPALLRLPALVFVNFAESHLARLSCLTAVVIFVALQLRMLLIFHSSLPDGSRMSILLSLMIAATVFSGPQLYILGSASIYHESVLWSAAIAAGFNFVVVRAAFGSRGLRTGELVSLAILAGLAINTRPTVGTALYLSTTLLVGWTAWNRWHTGACSLPALARAPCIWLPFTFLGLLAIAVGIVNFERWGNSFTFADFRYYGWLQRNPNAVRAFNTYGEINFSRIWIGALYYATGLPYLLKGVSPIAEFLRDRVAGIEAPPITPLLTNPLTIWLAGIGLYRFWSQPELVPKSTAILGLALIGDASAVIFVLAYMYLTMRYRFDFAPFMTLAALIGYVGVSKAAARRSDTWRNRVCAVAVAWAVLGIVGSHYILLVHKVWSIAVPMPVRLALFPYAPFAHAAFGQ
jgi:hypothetical protein